MFGKVQQVPQTELTPFYPRSPYGVSKLYAHWMAVNYRESYDMFATSGILFNHESPLRGREFVTRKITDAVARIKLGQMDTLELGNIDAQRDWGFAADYVEGMYLMLQAAAPDTYVLATSRTVSVREFVNLSFSAAGIEIEWSGSGGEEAAVNRETGKPVVQINPRYYRPAEVDMLIGDAGKARRELGWSARTSVEDLCARMVAADIARNEKGFAF
jgi:GDPmannose 4,6-dehydratase